MRLFPDEPLDAALRLLAMRPRIQVVSRMNPEQVIATLSLQDVHEAYGIHEESRAMPEQADRASQSAAI
jgi:hypothetical protein